MIIEEPLVCSRAEMESITGRFISSERWQRFINSINCQHAMTDVMNYYLDMLENDTEGNGE